MSRVVYRLCTLVVVVAGVVLMANGQAKPAADRTSNPHNVPDIVSLGSTTPSVISPITDKAGRQTGHIVVSPASLSFPDEGNAREHSHGMVEIANHTGQTLVFGRLDISPNFAVTANQCGNSLVTNARCRIHVRFLQNASGPLTGTLTINETSPLASQTVTLAAKGNTNQIQVSPSALSFPDTAIPATSLPQAVVVTNRTGRILTFGSIAVSPNFTVTQNQCGSALGKQASCNIYVALAPTATGALTGSLTINESSPAGSQSVALSGKGLSGGVVAGPASLNFPDTTIPAASSSQAVTLTNYTGQTVFFGATTTSPNFAVTSNGCLSSLAAGASCQIAVRFAPAASGNMTGALTINETGPAGAQTVALSGKALSGGVPVSPASLSFPDTTIPAASSSQAVTLTNYTGQALTFGPITASSNFAVTSNGCGSSLAAGASCQIAVQFAPAATGNLNGSLTINETGPAGSQTVALSGKAVSGGVPASPASLSFPDTTIPAASSSQAVTLTNYTGQALTFGPITASSNFAVTSNGCGSSLAAGASCQIAVQFAPAATGILNGSLTINETGPAGTQTVALSGKALSGGVPASPAALGFPDTTIPATSSSQAVKLTNYTGQMLTFGTVTASSNFAVTSNGCSSLAAGASCQIAVQFAPSTSGQLSGALTINTSPAGTQTVALSGKAVSGGVQITPASLSFADTTIPAASSPQVVNLTNYTGQTLALGSMMTSPNFAVTSNACGNSLAAGANCQVYVQFAPAASGDLSGALTINEVSPVGIQTVALWGKGLNGGVPVNPGSLNFPDTTIPAVSSPQTLNLTNYTGQTLVFGTIAASSNFAVAANGCGNSLAPGGTCQVSVRFAPSTPGDLSGLLTIYETSPAGTQTIALSGRAISGGVLLNPASLSFPEVTLPGASSAQVVSLTNNTGQVLTFGNVSASDNFVVTQNQCGSPLAPGASCQIYVQFAPTASGDLSGTLTISEASPAGTQTVALLGRALSGGLQLSTASLGFPDTHKGGTSASQAVQIKNYTGQTLTLSAAASGDFSVALNNCTAPLIEGGSCSIYVQFNPTSVGQLGGTLTISGTAGTQTVALAGVGLDAGKAPLLQLQVKNSPAAVNLSLADADHPALLDWIVWGADDNGTITRKAGANLITDGGIFGPLPADLSIDNVGFISFNWTGGTTVPQGNNVQPEMYTTTSNNGFQLRVPADNTARTLNIYAGIFGTATLEASLDDGSGLTLNDVSVVSVQEVDKTYSIDYRSASPTTLTVRISVSFPDGDPGGVALQAATLQPYVPRVLITSPIDGQSFAAPANVAAAVQAVPQNAAVSQVGLTVDAGTPVIMYNTPYSTTLSSMPAGHHVLAAKAIDAAGLVGLADPTQIDVINGTGTGSLSASLVTMPDYSTVDLTKEGTAGWILWAADPSGTVRKKSVPNAISDYTILGNHSPTTLCGGNYMFSFSDGDAYSSATSISNQVCVTAPGNGFELTVNAGQTPRTLRLYVGADYGTAKLTAFLSDGSAPAIASGPNGVSVISEEHEASNTVYVINFNAGAANQKLTVRFTLDTDKSDPSSGMYGEVILHAATLQ